MVIGAIAHSRCTVIFDFPLDSFGIHAFYHSNPRVIYMDWVRDVGGFDSRSRRDLEVHVGSGRTAVSMAGSCRPRTIEFECDSKIVLTLLIRSLERC